MTMKTLGPMIVSLLLVARVAAQEPPKSQPPIWSAKPDVAAFEAAENDRLASVQRAVEQVVAVKGARTVENTLAPFDEATRQLNAAYYLASTMEQVHPEAAFRDHASAMVRKASAVQTALSLNRDVYQALAGLDLSAADASTRYYVQRQLLEFRLAGVDKDDATRARLKKLNDQLTERPVHVRPQYRRRPEHHRGHRCFRARWPAAGLHRKSQAGRRRQDSSSPPTIRTFFRR